MAEDQRAAVPHGIARRSDQIPHATGKLQAFALPIPLGCRGGDELLPCLVEDLLDFRNGGVVVAHRLAAHQPALERVDSGEQVFQLIGDNEQRLPNRT